MMKFNKHNLCFAVSLLFIVLASCQDEDYSREDRIEGKEVQVNFDVKCADLTVSPSRAQTTNEANINDIKVLVFVGGAYKYTVTGKNVAPASGSVTFNAMLYSTSSPVTLFILANAGSILTSNPLTQGDSQSAVATKLTTSFASAGISGSFPMFGSYLLPSGLNALVTNTITGINMMRNMARVDVDATAVSSKFQLASIQAFRANNTVQVIPNSLASNTAVTNPSIPSVSVAGVNTTVISPTTGTSSSTSQLYLPESVAPPAANQVTQATCVVIGGYYNGSSTLSYYRIDFNPGTSGNPFGQILRNYQYSFTVQNINAAGYATPALASNNAPSSAIQSIVRVWDSNSSNMSFDGSYYLGVSANPVVIGSVSNASVTLSVNTNTAYTMQWANATGVGSGTPGTSLNNGTFSIAQQGAGSSLQITALAANTTGAPITHYVLLTASAPANNVTVLLAITETGLNVTPTPITISASGGVGFAKVSSASLWSNISGQTWVSATQAVDSLKWTAVQNPGTTARTGNFLVSNFSGENVTVPYTQNGQNTTVVNILSINDGQPGQLGTDGSVSSVNSLVQGLKGILAQPLNFGSGGTINMAGFNFTATNNLTAASLSGIHILYIGTPNNVMTATQCDAIFNWLAGATNRVLVIGMDVNKSQSVLTRFGIGSPTYKNVNIGRGNHTMFYNSSTTYFSSNGPFTSYPYTPMAAGVVIRNQDAAYCEINTTTYPSVTKIVQGPGGDSVLGIDPARRVVYVGDQNIFQSGSSGTGLVILNITGAINNDASKLVANLWAWITNTALGNQPAL